MPCVRHYGTGSRRIRDALVECVLDGTGATRHTFRLLNLPALWETAALADDRGSMDLIVTDLGGTLVKTGDAILAAVHKAAKELGIPEGHPDPVCDVFGTSIQKCIGALQLEPPST